MLRRERDREWKRALSELVGEGVGSPKREELLSRRKREEKLFKAKLNRPICFYSRQASESIADRIVGSLYRKFSFTSSKSSILEAILDGIEAFQAHFTVNGFLYRGHYFYFDARDFEAFFLWGLENGFLDCFLAFDFLSLEEGRLFLEKLIPQYYDKLARRWGDISSCGYDEEKDFLQDGLLRAGNFVIPKRHHWIVFVYRIYRQYFWCIPQDLYLERFVDMIPFFEKWLKKQTDYSVSFFERLVAYGLIYYIETPTEWNMRIKEKILADIGAGTLNEVSYPLNVKIFE